MKNKVTQIRSAMKKLSPEDLCGLMIVPVAAIGLTVITISALKPAAPTKTVQPAPVVAAAPAPAPAPEPIAEAPAPATEYASEAEQVKAAASDRMAESLLERCEQDWLPSTCVKLRAELEAARR